MAEHQSSPATTARSPNKSSWLAALDELEKQFLAFQKRCAGPISSAHTDRAAPDIALSRRQDGAPARPQPAP
jgi:hypothetical protein